MCWAAAALIRIVEVSDERSIPVISKTWFTTFTEALASCVLDCKDILILGDIHRGMENKNYGILGNLFAWFFILFWPFSNFCMLHCHDIIEKKHEFYNKTDLCGLLYVTVSEDLIKHFQCLGNNSAWFFMFVSFKTDHFLNFRMLDCHDIIEKNLNSTLSWFFLRPVW